MTIEAQEILRELEWGIDWDGVHACPVCHGLAPLGFASGKIRSKYGLYGHDAGCSLLAQLPVTLTP